MVIPAMDHIDSVFTSCMIKRERLDPAIRAGLELAKRTLNRYYSLTDASEAYRIAMGMSFTCFLFVFQVLNLSTCHSAPSPSQTCLL